MSYYDLKDLMREQRLQERIAEQQKARTIVVARTETTIVRPNQALFGAIAERDAFADEMLRRERQAEADAEYETNSEGRQYRNVRPQRHE